MSPKPASERRPRRLGAREWTLIGVIAVLVIALIGVLVTVWPRPTPEAVAVPTPTSAPSAAATPTPTPTPTGFGADTGTYDLAALPRVNVFAVIPALPVDTEPDAPFIGYSARAIAEAAPVWADPAGEPVAALPREFTYEGTTVAVIERQQHWVHVLLTGRQARPSEGDAGQLTGWLRVADVDLVPVEAAVEVSLSEHTVDIVRDGVAERIATDFAWGTEATPTPVGRSFIMMTRAVPEFGYTRGHPLVYLSVQSATLDDFGGSDAAVTAFHYHDQRTGAISNGCIRVDESVIAHLAELPQGTGVHIRP